MRLRVQDQVKKGSRISYDDGRPGHEGVEATVVAMDVRRRVHEDAGEGVATEVGVGIGRGELQAATGEVVAHGPEPGEQ
jgi:hypothetical protein